MSAIPIVKVSTTQIEGTEHDTPDQFSVFRGCVLEGRWDYVTTAYKNDSAFHKIKINESRGTALHVAVNDGKAELVNLLVSAIIEHEGMEVRHESALRATNERLDTPLHLAASRGFIGMCKCIIGKNGERKDLIKAKNKKGETPLFKAVLTCKIPTFVYLHNLSKPYLDVPLWNNDGDTILHCAIRSEFFDLAIIIIDCYGELVDKRNKDGVTPLKILATRPSTFKSGSNLSWWKEILYHCMCTKPLDAKKAVKSSLEINEVTVLVENEAKVADTRFPPKCATSLWVVYSSFCSKFISRGLSLLGISVSDFKIIKKIKQNHVWGIQLLRAFMQRASESYMGTTGGQPFELDDLEDKGVTQPFISQEQLERLHSEIAKKGKGSPAQKPEEDKKNEFATKIDKIMNELHTTLDKEGLLLVAMKNIENKSVENIDRNETPYLTAAKNGIVEIVSELQHKIPSVVHETNSNNENVLLVAVKNRQPLVVEELRKKLDEELFNSLILEVDNNENTVLHLAAGTTINSAKTWRIAGAALQMMWDIKWYQYIKELVPEHFIFRTNKDDKSARDIFKEKHQDLVKNSSEWLKETSESCSVVAALIAGVSFASSSSVPGGTENGKPALEGQPAFDTFAIASLVGLCFSVTALVMFLSILTSRKQAEDFRRSLPFKLLLGLSSLFVSIASMLVSFCAAHSFVLKDKYKHGLFPVYVATSLPVTFYAAMQFPLYADIVKAIFKKVPQPSYKSDHL